jgi:asparagine synthase (glutamine-hydrolysing)
MCDIQAHRGPDDAGYALFSPSGDRPDGALSAASYHDPLFRRAPKTRVFDSKAANSPSCLLALGHRRLSILDLSSLGHQPLESSEGGLWTVYNGELYNYPELKASLQAAGRKFKTGSDTEALLELWRIKGRGALELFDGMFALAMYDSRANKLFLARDRFGVKPLYYALSSDGQFLLFASEIKGILASGLLKPEIDPSGVAEYFTFQNQFGEQTLFKGVSRLMPCETLEVSPGRGEISRSRYFKHNFSMDFSADSGERTSMTLTSLFEAAVSRQLISDVDVGSYLSGGMDSGSIVAVAGRKIPRVLTFTGGFDLTNVSGIELSFDERRMAERLSYLLQTEHYDVVLHAGDMPAVMERLTWHNDDLRVGMCHQNWYVAKLASRFVKVCLAGAGGDELFGGYPWRYELALRAKDLASFDDGLFKFWHRALPCDELPRVFSPAVSGFEGVARAPFRSGVVRRPGLGAFREQGGESSPARHVLRVQHLPARLPLRRGSPEHGAWHGEQGPIPGQRLGRFRAPPSASSENEYRDAGRRAFRQGQGFRRSRRQAHSSKGYGQAASQGIPQAAQAGLLPSGRKLVPRTFHGLHKEHLVRRADLGPSLVRPGIRQGEARRAFQRRQEPQASDVVVDELRMDTAAFRRRTPSRELQAGHGAWKGAEVKWSL